jgi:prephenate dehydrogenase
VATHAAVLAFGAALLDLSYDASAALRLATPPHRLLMSVLYRIISQNPEVYWEIQHDHPAGPVARRALANGIEQIDACLSKSDKQSFLSLFGSLREMLQDESGTLAGWTHSLMSSPPR